MRSGALLTPVRRATYIGTVIATVAMAPATTTGLVAALATRFKALFESPATSRMGPPAAPVTRSNTLLGSASSLRRRGSCTIGGAGCCCRTGA